jgi:hypothetical protein
MNYWTPLNYEGFEQYLIKKSTHKYWGGFQYEFQFDNGFGASVIKHNESYGNIDDLFELGVLDENGELTYETDITNNVIGWLTNEEVIEYFKAIQSL